MSQTATVPMAYFGKVPSRGDFVRSASQAPLTQKLDRWLTQGLELMSDDPRWKEIYDHAAPVNFAFLGVKSRALLAGHLIPSTDTSGRRFPFVAAGTLDVGSAMGPNDAPLAFLARNPTVLTRLWARFEQAAQLAFGATEAGAMLGTLNQTHVDVDVQAHAYDPSLQDFLDLQTVGELESMLRQSGHSVNLRRTLLALGLLLQPVPTSGSSTLDKGISLPLPADPLYLPYVATLWVELVARFLTRGDFEVVLYVSTGGNTKAPMLQVGFSGGSPATLQAALDPHVGRTVFVDLSDAEWVESQTGKDYGIKKLSSYLEQPQLSLRQALSTFGETFLGD